MKKALLVLLAVMMCFSLIACGDTATGGPAAVDREPLHIYLDGVAVKEGGFSYNDLKAKAADKTFGDSTYFGTMISDIAGVDTSAVKGVFFRAYDGFYSYAGDLSKTFIAAFEKKGEEYTSLEAGGKAYYKSIIDGGISSDGVNTIYLVTTACDWSVDIQVDGKSVGALTMADFMKKTQVGDNRVATAEFEGGFKYNGGASTYEGNFLGINYETMLNKLIGLKMPIPEYIENVEFYGNIAAGGDGLNKEYDKRPDNDKYFGLVDFFVMFDGKIVNELAPNQAPAGLTAFINYSGMRWTTQNLTAINFISGKAPEKTTATAPETTTTAAPENTTAAAPDVTVPAGPEKVAREALYVYLDGQLVKEGGFTSDEVYAAASDKAFGNMEFYGASLPDLVKDVDFATVKGLFFKSTDGFYSFGADHTKTLVVTHEKNKKGYSSVDSDDGKAYYGGFIEGGMYSTGVHEVYLVTTAADWTVDIQVDGKSVGALTMADFMKKTHTPDTKIPTAIFDGSFMYAGGASKYEGSFLGIDYDTLLKKLAGLKIELPAVIENVEYYGTIAAGGDGLNKEYDKRPDNDKFYGAVDFFCMFDGKTFNELAPNKSAVGLTAFINYSGLRWMTQNLTAINFISGKAPETTAAEPEKTTAAAPETTAPAAPEKTTAAAPETTAPAAPEKTTAAAPETTAPAAPEKTTAAAPETTAPAAPEAIAREALHIYIDGVEADAAGYAYDKLTVEAKAIGDAEYYGSTIAGIAGIDTSAVKGVFFKSYDGFITYTSDINAAFLAAFEKSGDAYESHADKEGKNYYKGVIDVEGAQSNKYVDTVYLVTTAADWTVDIQVDGTSVGKLTMADFMKKTEMPDGERLGTGLYEGAFMYAGGSAKLEGNFLGFGYNQMVAKLKGLGMAIPETVTNVEYIGIKASAAGSEPAVNTEYDKRSDNEKFYGAVDFFVMFEGKTFNDLAPATSPVGLTVFTNYSGLRWMTENLTVINFVTK